MEPHCHKIDSPMRAQPVTLCTAISNMIFEPAQEYTDSHSLEHVREIPSTTTSSA